MGVKKDGATYLFLKFLMVKTDSLNVVSHNVHVLQERNDVVKRVLTLF
jgi:hypothetical protein